MNHHRMRLQWFATRRKGGAAAQYFRAILGSLEDGNSVNVRAANPGVGAFASGTGEITVARLPWADIATEDPGRFIFEGDQSTGVFNLTVPWNRKVAEVAGGGILFQAWPSDAVASPGRIVVRWDPCCATRATGVEVATDEEGNSSVFVTIKSNSAENMGTAIIGRTMDPAMVGTGPSGGRRALLLALIQQRFPPLGGGLIEVTQSSTPDADTTITIDDAELGNITIELGADSAGDPAFEKATQAALNYALAEAIADNPGSEEEFVAQYEFSQCPLNYCSGGQDAYPDVRADVGSYAIVAGTEANSDPAGSFNLEELCNDLNSYDLSADGWILKARPLSGFSEDYYWPVLPYGAAFLFTHEAEEGVAGYPMEAESGYLAEGIAVIAFPADTADDPTGPLPDLHPINVISDRLEIPAGRTMLAFYSTGFTVLPGRCNGEDPEDFQEFYGEVADIYSPDRLASPPSGSAYSFARTLAGRETGIEVESYWNIWGEDTETTPHWLFVNNETRTFEYGDNPDPETGDGSVKFGFIAIDGEIPPIDPGLQILTSPTANSPLSASWDDTLKILTIYLATGASGEVTEAGNGLAEISALSIPQSSLGANGVNLTGELGQDATMTQEHPLRRWKTIPADTLELSKFICRSVNSRALSLGYEALLYGEKKVLPPGWDETVDAPILPNNEPFNLLSSEPAADEAAFSAVELAEAINLETSALLVATTAETEVNPVVEETQSMTLS